MCAGKCSRAVEDESTEGVSAAEMKAETASYVRVCISAHTRARAHDGS